MENFNQLGLPQPLLRALEKMEFSTPTPIQALSIPVALQGRDILGSAQTGTGKTAAFAIPMIAKLLNEQKGMALIMTPTRELAVQVHATVKLLLSGAPQLKTALLIGGQSMFNQKTQLRARPRIIIGTPGRINDHLEQNSVNLSFVNFLVLDETDRMLDMGFGPQIDRVVRRIPRERQTLLFSATLPPDIVKAAQQYMRQPERIAVGSTTQPLEAIKQEQIKLQPGDKYPTLMKQLAERQGSIIVFVRTKYGADKMAKKISRDGHSAIAIHGNLNQNQRTRALQAFRDEKCRVMVATDIAARGLDVPHVAHVINYDLPRVAEEYIHRIGRTARNGATGSAVAFVTPEDHKLWVAIQRLLDPDFRPAPGANENSNAHANGRPQQHGQRRGNGERGGRHRHRQRDAQRHHGERGERNDRNEQRHRGTRDEPRRQGGRDDQGMPAFLRRERDNDRGRGDDRQHQRRERRA